MTRVTLTDGTGHWFDDEKAAKFSEDTWWNGNNHISWATGSQWDHEALFYTSSGRWVLNSWSQYQSEMDTYEEIDEAEAIRWLCNNDCWEDSDTFATLPISVQESVKQGIAANEL